MFKCKCLADLACQIYFYSLPPSNCIIVVAVKTLSTCGLCLFVAVSMSWIHMWVECIIGWLHRDTYILPKAVCNTTSLFQTTAIWGGGGGGNSVWKLSLKTDPRHAVQCQDFAPSLEDQLLFHCSCHLNAKCTFCIIFQFWIIRGTLQLPSG